MRDEFQSKPAESSFLMPEKRAHSQSGAKWLQEYAYLDPENDSDKISSEQERGLALLIQDGIAAQEEKTQAGTVSENQELESRIADGMRARQALFDIHTPFALYYARESVGISHLESNRKILAIPFARIAGNAAGTYKPLSSMKSPYADLEHRQQSALEALWHATSKFLPITEGHDGRTAKFVTYAAWHIQSKISRDVHIEEHNGIRLPEHVHQKIGQYFRSAPQNDELLTTEIDELIKKTDYEAYPEVLPRKEADKRELDDPWSEDDHGETLADIWVDDRQQVESMGLESTRAERIQNLLSSITEREAGVISARFGLHGVPMTFEEVGFEYGLTRERIRQIEIKAMAKLRHPTRSKLLEGLLDLEQGYTSSAVRGDHVVIPNSEIVKDEIVQQYESAQVPADNREWWQLTADEEWDIPMRTDAMQVENLVSQTSFERIFAMLGDVSSWHFDKRSDSISSQPYSVTLMNTFEKLAQDKVLSVSQLEQVWALFADKVVPELEKKLGEHVSYDRIGRFFSKLVASSFDVITERNSAEMVLTIPESLDGKIPYLASSLSNGSVVINGNPGEYVAANNSSFAEVVVYGSVGDKAGAAMRGYATLEISGNAGRETGVQMKDNASIIVHKFAAGTSVERDETTSVVSLFE